MNTEIKHLKQRAQTFFKDNKRIRCPAFPEEVVLNSKGLSHLFYKGSRKTTSRSIKEIVVRLELLSRALKLLKMMSLPQEESVFTDSKGRKCHFFAFEAVVDERRIKVIVRQVGNGKKHFWSVIPAWRKVRGQRVNAKTDLSKQ